MKSKSQIPGWAILVLVLAVALLAAVTIAMLHQYANESRQAELLLSRLKGQSYHLDALEWQFEMRPDPKLLEQVRQVKNQIAQTFDELMLLDPGEERLQQLHKTQLEFETSMDEMFRLIAAGDLEKADILDKERVDPGFNALSDMITNTSAVYSDRAQQAQRKAGIGTTLVVIAAGMMVGSLILRFQKMQLRAKLITVEQKVLRQSEERYRTIIETAHDLIWTLDNEGNFTFFNRRSEETSGYKLSELIGKSFAPLIFPEDLPKVHEIFLKTLQGNPQSYDVRVYKKDEQMFILSVNTVPLYENDKIIGTVSFGRDITEHKRVEEKLRLFRNLIDQSNDAIFVGDPETGRILDANDKACTGLGYKREELLSMHVFDFETVLPDHFSWKEHVQEVKKKGYLIFEGRQRRKDGAIFPVEVNISYVSLEKNNYMLTVARDITERKRAEEELRKSEERFRQISESAGEWIWEVDADGLYTYSNPVIEKILGYKPQEIIGKKHFYDLFVPDVREELKKAAFENFARKESFRGFVNPNVHTNGNIVILETSGLPILDGMGNLLGYRGTDTDITEHKRSEEQVQEQAALLDKAQDAILVRNLEDCITYWNKSAQRLYGWTAEEAIGKNASEILYKNIEDSLHNIEARKSVLERGEWNGELYHVTKDGREVIVESRWTLMHDNKGKTKSILVINTDITGKKKLEEQFLRAQRMESVGTLAGGIAHDINNVLTPIMLSLELLKEKFTDNKSQQLIDILDRSAKRGASLIKQVQSFARGVEGERMPLQTAHLISEIRQIAKETFPRNIEIMTDIQKDLWTISGDATQLHQVLMNLCVNARDAMPDGGILSISAGNIFIDENFTHIDIEARVGHYIVIAVTDTGAGIPPKIMDRMFEPFFTTKENGKGTGLGLSTALGIVKSHGGFINVYSEAGKGTTFKVYLPAITTTETQKAEEPTHERFRGSGELILIVDDEAQIRDITSSALQTNGYRVLTANNGLEAISLYEQNREEIKIVLMDMMMPVMDGLASIQELRKINPQLKIIAASGLTEKDKLTKAAGTMNAFLPKPYTAEKLLRTIHEILSAE
ncbi:MAG: PAS domain S-box protein [Candidatus Methanoperedens sp.]